MYNDDFLNKKLDERKSLQALRQLKISNHLIDFCSNDYLGVAKNNLLNGETKVLATGSTGSRLLAGNYALIEEVEKQIAVFHQADEALIYNSGYDANIGLLSCVPQKGDTILYDQLSHASIRDGIRLSFAQAFSFEHNNVEDLKKKLHLASGNIFVVTESVFSMDGDIAPLQKLVQLCKQFNAHLIVDEAHATGIIGEKGEGLVQQLQLQQEVFARIHTFGKALGTHGAVVLGSKNLKDYLINFSRSLMYSTALPPCTINHIQKAYSILPSLKAERQNLQSLIQLFGSQKIRYKKLDSSTPIQAIIIPGNETVKTVAHQLQQKGFDVRPIVYPTVPKNTERLRIVLHSYNTEEEVINLCLNL